MKAFNNLEIRLEGTNLVEASAGTGKTYSLAILALRLIIEKNVPLKQILMVTFTIAATAELEVRIRSFIREAYRYISKNHCDDLTIQAVVNNAINALDLDTVKRNLQNAVNNLDESSVMTIHSFCQNTLNEFQFEADQLDMVEILPDISEIIDFEVNEFWRKRISVLDDSILIIVVQYIDKNKFKTVLQKTLEGRHFISKSIKEQEAIDNLFVRKTAIELANQGYEEHIKNEFESICERAKANSYARKFLNEKCENIPEKFIIEFFRLDKTAKYVKETFVIELELFERIKVAEDEFRKSVLDYCGLFYNEIIEISIPNIATRLKQLNFVSYNDLISKTHKAVKTNKLTEPLNAKYKAIFIDEFQDTDKLQYEIFDQVFDGNATMFYVGDPKQSIYGWRKADISTYIAARTKIDLEHCFSMDLNYRSTSRMVEAINLFFKPTEDFDTFKSVAIKYREASSNANQGDFYYEDKPVIPLTVIENKKNEEIFINVGLETLRLLNDKKFTILDKDGKSRVVLPSDIAIIVRNNNQGKDVKAELSKYNIPAITMDTEKVLHSNEARFIQKIVSTIVRPNRKKINSLLADEFFGFDLNSLLCFDDEKLIEIFSNLNDTASKSGIYNTLSTFINEFSIIDKCLSEEEVNGQRILTNFYQIMEILHNMEVQKKYDLDELCIWFEKACLASNANDEYQQRIESDENAVRIITIHKCKGLTFNIVLAPFLDFFKHPTDDGIDFRDDHGQHHFCFDFTEEMLELHNNQLIQENTRLIYVALTRAVYKTYVYRNTFYKETELTDFLKSYSTPESKNRISNLIEINPVVNGVVTKYNQTNQKPKANARAFPNIEYLKTWDVHSFSSLSHKHEIFTSEPIEIDDSYNNFVFNEMPKGAKAGLFLHSIFEHLDFTQPNQYAQGIDESGKFYSSVFMQEHADFYLQLVKQCMEVPITNEEGNTFHLNEVAQEKKLPELEFYFSLGKHLKSEIVKIFPDIEFSTELELEGMMHGFIDLLFEHQGMYYILDWKSNYLGNQLSDYEREGLLRGMGGNNYHLQYCIYSVAVKRYLEKKGVDFSKQFGGVIYMFLRGVRSENGKTGIYYNKPSLEALSKLDKLFL